jgi:hypothetical protein
LMTGSCATATGGRPDARLKVMIAPSRSFFTGQTPNGSRALLSCFGTSNPHARLNTIFDMDFI